MRRLAASADSSAPEKLSAGHAPRSGDRAHRDVNDAPYEYKSHAKLALKEGLTQSQLEALECWENSDQFDAPMRAVLAYTDAMTRNIRVPDKVFEAVRTIYDVKQTTDLTILIGSYNMVSRFLEALHVGR